MFNRLRQKGDVQDSVPVEVPPSQMVAASLTKDRHRGCHAHVTGTNSTVAYMSSYDILFSAPWMGCAATKFNFWLIIRLRR
jgi:hypothetical protein